MISGLRLAQRPRRQIVSRLKLRDFGFQFCILVLPTKLKPLIDRSVAGQCVQLCVFESEIVFPTKTAWTHR